MKILDNIISTVRDDLRVEIKKGSKVSIAAACFSMYAYKELKKQLESVDEFRFIFTSPTFVKEKAEKQKREFYIPRLSRETSLYGTEFEIKLRNEMTQRAIAKECADWIRKKAKFKSNTTDENMAGFMTVDSKTAQTAYMPINGFTTVDIGCERGNNSYNMVNCMEAPFAQQYMQLFDGLWNDREKMQDVTDMVLENISTAYAENSPEFIYFMTLYHVFSEFLDDISEDELPNEATGFKQAQKAFNAWSKLPQEERTTDALLRTLDFDFFELLDSVTIARSRKHIEKYYDTNEIGKFPERLKPISKCPCLTDLNNAINYNEIYEQLMQLSLCVYAPSNYIFPSKLQKYKKLTHNKGENLTQTGREQGIRRLMSINLLKRLESSVHSFQLTLTRIKELINGTIQSINQFEAYGRADLDMYDAGGDDFDIDDENSDFFTVGKKVKIDLADMDWKSWRTELKRDAEVLELLTFIVADITPEHDTKLQELLKLVSDKIEHPINNQNKKVLIFSAFSDTAEYLYDHVSEYIKKNYGLNTAVITGSIDGKTTIKGFQATLNNVLTCFSPVSKGRDVLMPGSTTEIDVLIATDCISEGQNLQDCDYLINYDIHWNPVRIIQRFGRVDRIGSRNQYIQLVNFWPDLTLDEYINLKSRVETRMKITVMTSTGDDDLINPEEKGDLEYRKAQLKRLQEEVVDIEDMSDGISIMDLGLNEFRLDLLDYIKRNGDMDKKPRGLHAVVPATDELPEGVIFVLRNINNSVNVDNRNRIHPFYMVYIGVDGQIICDYLNPKKMLDDIRLLCRGKFEPIKEAYERFNRETNDGRNMAEMSELPSEAINSIIDVKEESDIDSLFSAGGTSALMSDISGLDDFELICFLVVK